MKIKIFFIGIKIFLKFALSFSTLLTTTPCNLSLFVIIYRNVVISKYFICVFSLINTELVNINTLMYKKKKSNAKYTHFENIRLSNLICLKWKQFDINTCCYILFVWLGKLFYAIIIILKMFKIALKIHLNCINIF